MSNIEKQEKKFLEYVSDMVTYWDEHVDKNLNQKERLEGLAFSILSYIDGCSGEPHSLIPADYTSGKCSYSFNNDISGSLHELFYEVHREKSDKTL